METFHSKTIMRFALPQDSDAPEELMAAFGTAGSLIQQSEFVHCRCRHAELDETAKDSASLADIDEESLAAAKQVQKELQKAMHAALSSNNGILIIPTMPGPPIQSRCATQVVLLTLYNSSSLPSVALSHCGYESLLVTQATASLLHYNA